jgi:hypothetical protein
MTDAMFWITLLASVAAMVSAMISYLVYASQVHPEIVVYTEYDVKVPTIIYLVIENIGKSAARDIRFWSSRAIPRSAFGRTSEEIESWPKETMTYGPLVAGIPFLAPRGVRRIMWGQYPGLFAQIGSNPIRIVASYRSRQNDILDWQEHKTESIVEVASYQATEMGDNDSLRKIANQTERIANILDKIREQREG